LPKSNADGAGAGSSKPALPSYWIPSLTPQAEKTRLTKPDKTVYCPMTGNPLRMKDLIEVKFKEIRDDDAAKTGQVPI
jgi:nitric oxide synthase-interacting protein